jgi:Flp pilus assembly protein TadB
MKDDYYTLLGVDPDATTDDIRTAYRTRKDALDTATDAGKADAAKLNKAWNVLSDPYQRGRYDEQRARASDDDEADDDVSVEPASNGARRPQPRQRRPAAAPTITLPTGMRWPLPRMRMVAMGIDLFVLLVLFIGSQFAAQAIAKSAHKATYDCVTALRSAVDSEPTGKRATEKQSNAKVAKAQQKCRAANVTVTGAYADDNKTFNDQAGKLTPISQAVAGAFFLVAFLYLLVPTIASGRTLGKRFQHLKILREDGSRLRVGDAIKRWGPLVLAVYAVSIYLGPLAAVLGIVAVTTWMRNPNFQGWHDRFAHTIVVNDAA